MEDKFRSRLILFLKSLVFIFFPFGFLLLVYCELCLLYYIFIESMEYVDKKIAFLFLVTAIIAYIFYIDKDN